MPGSVVFPGSVVWSWSVLQCSVVGGVGDARWKLVDSLHNSTLLTIARQKRDKDEDLWG